MHYMAPHAGDGSIVLWSKKLANFLLCLAPFWCQSPYCMHMYPVGFKRRRRIWFFWALFMTISLFLCSYKLTVCFNMCCSSHPFGDLLVSSAGFQFYEFDMAPMRIAKDSLNSLTACHSRQWVTIALSGHESSKGGCCQWFLAIILKSSHVCQPIFNYDDSEVSYVLCSCFCLPVVARCGLK